MKRSAAAEWQPLTLPESISPPDEADYQETTQLFADFTLPIPHIPTFRTRNALIIWRTNYIRSQLERVDALEAPLEEPPERIHRKIQPSELAHAYERYVNGTSQTQLAMELHLSCPTLRKYLRRYVAVLEVS